MKNEHETDADGVRIITGKTCARLGTIDAAIETANRYLYLNPRNSLLLEKLKIARKERERFEGKGRRYKLTGEPNDKRN